MNSNSRTKYGLMLPEVVCFKIMIVLFLLFVISFITAVVYNHKDPTISTIFGTLSVTFIVFEILFIILCGLYFEKNEFQHRLLSEISSGENPPQTIV